MITEALTGPGQSPRRTAPASRRGAGVIGRDDRIDIAACILLVIACTLAKLLLLEPVGPLIFFDELLYRQGAEALAGHGPYPSGQYPFLYPLLLAPAEAMGAGYQGIFVTNVLASSTLIPACWLLARTVGMKWGWPCALAAALLPLQWVFPLQVMSENLFVPLFAWTVWYAIRARAPSPAGSLVFGAGLASLFLVKYLAMPAIPVLWAAWLFGLAAGGMPRRSLLSPAGLSMAAATAMLVAWLGYAHANGIGFAESLGAKVSGLHAGELMTPAAVLMWAVAYLCVLVLLAAPFLPRLMEGVGLLATAPLRLLRESPLARLLLLCLLLAGGYWLVCIQHSAGAIRNYPVPQRVVARYTMHLTPLLLVLGSALTLTLAPLARQKLRYSIPLAALAAAAIWLSHQILYADLAWDFPHWFAGIPLYSTDILGYRPEDTLWYLIGLVLAGSLVGLDRRIAWAWMMAWLVLLGASTIEVYGRAIRDSTSRPLHARTLAPLVVESASKHGHVTVITELRREPPKVMQQALVFWGVDPATFSVIGPGREASAVAQGGEMLRVTNKPRGQRPLVEYRAGVDGTGYIYRERGSSRPRAEAPAGGASLEVVPSSGCDGEQPRVVTLAWDARASGVERVMVYVLTRNGEEKPFTGGPAVGRRETGPWATPGTTFRIRSARNDLLLAETSVEESPCD